MKLKFFKRIIVFGVLLTFITLCLAGFAGCNGGRGDDDPFEEPPIEEPPIEEPNEPNASIIGYFDLPDSFALSISAGKESFNFVKFDGSYYADSAREDLILSKSYLTKNGDSYAFYETSYANGELVWGEAQTLTADDFEKKARTMFTYILEKPDDDDLLENVSILDGNYQCRRTEISAGAGSMVCFVLEDYDFWVKNEITLSSGAVNTAEATLLNFSLTTLPEFVSLPA